MAIFMFLAHGAGLVTEGCSKYTIMEELWKCYKLIYNSYVYVELYFHETNSVEQYQEFPLHAKFFSSSVIY